MHYFFAGQTGSTQVMSGAVGNVELESDSYLFGGEHVITGTLNDPNTGY